MAHHHMARTNETRLRGTGFWDAVGYVLEENDRSDQEEEELRRPKMALEKKRVSRRPAGIQLFLKPSN